MVCLPACLSTKPVSKFLAASENCSFQLLLGYSFNNFYAVYPLSNYGNYIFLNQNTVFFIEWHVYKHSSDVRKYIISATLKNCKVSVRFDVKL